MKRIGKRTAALLLAAVLVCLLVLPVSASWSVTVNVNEYSRIVLCSAQSEDDVLSLPELADGSAWPRGMMPGEDGGEAILYGTPTETGVFRLTGSVYDNSINGYITFDVTVTVIDRKATPTPKPTEKPTAAPTNTPAPTTAAATPTPAPTNTPTPTATPLGAPVITKQPTKEIVNEGGSATFIANATGWAWCAWRFLSPDGKTEVIFDVTGDRFPGLTITGGNSTTLILEHIPVEMNGRKTVCLFSSATNLWSYTDGSAVISVNAAATPTPSPSPTASPMPSPTPTSEPTATPEPAAVPAAAADTATATPEPTATPAPEMAGKTGGDVLVIVLAAVIAVLIAAGAVMAVRLRRSGRGGGSHRK